MRKLRYAIFYIKINTLQDTNKVRKPLESSILTNFCIKAFLPSRQLHVQS